MAAGGSNRSRNHLWKYSLQKLANELKMKLVICHFPPGTSKWNKIEHRMFSHITKNWRGRPLISYEVIVQLIGATTTTKGLKIQAQSDNNDYPKGKRVSDEEMQSVNLQRADFHGEWNYMIAPHHRCKVEQLISSRSLTIDFKEVVKTTNRQNYTKSRLQYSKEACFSVTSLLVSIAHLIK